MNRLNEDTLTLDKPYLILKEVIKNLTRLCNVGNIPKKKSIQNKEVKTLTEVTGDQMALIILTIKDLITRYITHGISYKIFFKIREGANSIGVVYIAYKMIMEDQDFDLCSLLKDQLIENVQKTMEVDYPFKFGTLIICIMMFF